MKKIILSLFLVMLCCSLASAQSDFNPNIKLSVGPSGIQSTDAITATWSALAPSTNALSRSGAVAISVNDTVHIFQFGGGSGAQYTSMIRYNAKTNTWSGNAINGALIPAIPGNMSAASGVAIGDSVIYLFGGESTTTLGRTLKYNVKTNVWTTLASMPTPVTDAGVVKYKDSVVYVIGGGNGTFATGYFNTVQIYSIKNNSYSSGGVYPVTAGMMGIGIFGDTIVTAGGWDGTAAIANAYKGKINPITLQITWTPIAAYPAGTITRMASYFVRKGNGGGVVFSGGAIAGSTLTGSTYLYDLCAGTWNTLTANATPRSNMKGAGLGDSVMYVVAGFTTVGVGNTDKLTFSQIDGSCLTPPPPPTPTTLVLVHDTTLGGAATTKPNRDSLVKYLPSLISSFDVATFDTSSALPSLTNYKNIIVAEVSFNTITTRWLGRAARVNLMNWLNTGTPGNKKNLILMGGDEAYNYTRTGSAGLDADFGNVLGISYRVDDASGTARTVFNVATPTIMDSIYNANNYYPDGASAVNGGVPLLGYIGHTGADTLAGIGRVQTNYNVVTILQDPRYYQNIGGSAPTAQGRGLRRVLATAFAFCNANGGTITNLTPLSTVASNYVLSQNYPNPFNPVTKISFAIPTNGFVSLKVYNIVGKEVMTLVNKNMTVGSYSVDFNAALLSSGVYFYRLESGNFSETKKMMLVK